MKLQFLKLNDIFKLQQLKFYYKLIKGKAKDKCPKKTGSKTSYS